MIHARSASKLRSILTQHSEQDTTPRFSILFDMPSGHRAKMLITKDNEPMIVVTAFSWNETKPIRRIVKFGSNHAKRSVSWNSLAEVLFSMIEDKIYKAEIPHEDRRILRMEQEL